MTSVLSVDLALSINRLGICHLREDKELWTAHFVLPAELGIVDPMSPEALALVLYQYCSQENVGVLLIDGPQAWKDPNNGLKFCRKCEHALSTPAKTGVKGEVRPKPASRYVEFSIATFAELFKLGAREVSEFQIVPSSELLVAESFPTAAWRAIREKPLPSRTRVEREEIRRRWLGLQQQFGIAVEGDPTHDELQALVAGLAGIAIVEGRGDRYELVGVPPILLGDDLCEGFIVNPRLKSVPQAPMEMCAPPEHIRDLVFERLKINHAENARIEWKRQLVVSHLHQKAEFIRDVLSLANSEGEHPRTSGFLMIGAKDGAVVSSPDARIDGATLGQIIDAFIEPKLTVEHFKVPLDGGQNIDVVEIRPDSSVLYVVERELRDEHKLLLRPGESWGRSGDRKVALSGGDICQRFDVIARRRSDAAAAPLRQEITELREAFAGAGPCREAVRIVYELEHHMDGSDWAGFERAAQRLSPYLRDEREAVADVVLERIGPLLRIRFRMPEQAARIVLGMVGNCLPLHSHQGQSNCVSEKDLLQYAAASSIADEAAYDAIKYAKNLKILEEACQLLRGIGRVANLNRCRHLASRVQRIFNRLRDLAAQAEGNDFVQIIDYFEGESRLTDPELPPVFGKLGY